MSRVSANGCSISYRQTGTGPNLVFVHGLATSHAFWYLGVARAMQGQYRVTLYDLRGHGASGTPAQGYRPVDMARDLDGLLRHLGLERVILVGHSFGGAVALQYAVRQPQNVLGLVLADTRLTNLQPSQRLADSPLSEFEQQVVGESAADWSGEQDVGLRFLEEMAGGRGAPAHQRTNGFVPFGGSGRSTAAQQWLNLLQSTTARREVRADIELDESDLRALPMPVMLVYGERSRCMPTCRALAPLLSDCETVIVPGAGHFHPWSRPGAFVRALRPFALRCVHNRPVPVCLNNELAEKILGRPEARVQPESAHGGTTGSGAAFSTHASLKSTQPKNLF